MFISVAVQFVAFHFNTTLFDLFFFSFFFALWNSEVELGKIIQKYGWKRTGYVVTIKIYWSMKSEERGLSRKHIIESVKASLQRLQLSYVDVVIIYKSDPMCPMEGKWNHHSFIVVAAIVLFPLCWHTQWHQHVYFLLFALQRTGAVKSTYFIRLKCVL